VPTPSGRRASTLATGTAAVVLAALAAGCGGSSSPGVASIGTGPNASAGRPSFAAAYHCFAAHGYPDYRVPNAHKTGGNGWYRRGNQIVLTPAFQKLTSTARFQAAEKVCDPLFPPVKRNPAEVAAEVAQARKFAQCARAHGMPNIPDPGGDPPWLIDLNAAGINYDGPKFKDVLATCQSTLKNGLLPFIVGNGG
jgi:hypothetical protein